MAYFNHCFLTTTRWRTCIILTIAVLCFGALVNMRASDLTDWANTGTSLRGTKHLTQGGHNPMTDEIIKFLNRKLQNMSSLGPDLFPRTCFSDETIGNSCGPGGCLQKQLPISTQTRVQQVVNPAFLQIPLRYKKALTEMREAVPGNYDVLLVTGASSNHFEESLALLQNLHSYVFPYLQNFTLVYYDLGLLPDQRKHIAKSCRCQLVDFPFLSFPEYFTFLKCYTWKPIIINAHIAQTELLFWLDASIRFYKKPSKLISLLEQARQMGIQCGRSKMHIPHSTLRSMFHFFGDEACAYLPYQETMSGVSIFHNELLVTEAVLKPWAACALADECMCPHKEINLFHVRRSCAERRDDYDYGACHRFDQSAMSIILTKLFQDKHHHVMLENIRDYLQVKRGDKAVLADPV